MLREFPVLAGLEPVAWVPEGLVVAPFAGGRDATEQAARLAAVSLPWRTDPGPVPPLPFPSAVGGGVYRRSPGHAPAPPGVPEVVLVDGEGFGLAVLLPGVGRALQVPGVGHAQPRPQA